MNNFGSGYDWTHDRLWGSRDRSSGRSSNGFGLVAHDGTIENNRVKTLTDASILEYFRRLRSEKEFESRILFRQQFTLGYCVDEKWTGEVYFEHLSHSKILTDRINDGADILGVKAARRF